MKQNVLIELKSTRQLSEASFEASVAESSEARGYLPKMANVKLDSAFPVTGIPGLMEPDGEGTFEMAPDFSPESSTYVVRGAIEEKDYEQITDNDNVVGVYSDVAIQPFAVCPSNPVGTDADIERLLCVSKLKAQGMDGSGVTVAVVDSGINMAWLRQKGKNPNFDAARSWVPRGGLAAGSMPVGHGTMCAYDVCIAAPKCTLLDIALLSSKRGGGSAMEGLLSDAVRAYAHLLRLMRNDRQPGENPSLVVNNSWGMFHPSWDYPVGHPGNYSDNPNHPFNRIVATLEAAGADIVFAAGNCGRECPDRRCRNVTNGGIYGANSHPSVLSVAGVTKDKVRIGYSTQGPGRLMRNKPDIAGYTHFKGSEVWAADGGTSAATPVIAGVVAAIRNKRAYDPNSPAARPAGIRALLTSTAEDLGARGYDFDHGYGVVDGCAIATKFTPRIIWPKPQPRIERLPWICRIIPSLCQRIRVQLPERVPFSQVENVGDVELLESELTNELGISAGEFSNLDENAKLVVIGLLLGLLSKSQNQKSLPEAAEAGKATPCTCQD